MTEHDLLTLVLETANAADLRYQNWIQATFAVLVTTYFTSGKINHRFLAIVGLIYLMYSIAQLTAILFLHGRIFEFNQALLAFDSRMERSAIGYANVIFKHAVYCICTRLHCIFSGLLPKGAGPRRWNQMQTRRLAGLARNVRAQKRIIRWKASEEMLWGR